MTWLRRRWSFGEGRHVRFSVILDVFALMEVDMGPKKVVTRRRSATMLFDCEMRKLLSHEFIG